MLRDSPLSEHSGVEDQESKIAFTVPQTKKQLTFYYFFHGKGAQLLKLQSPVFGNWPVSALA